MRDRLREVADLGQKRLAGLQERRHAGAREALGRQGAGQAAQALDQKGDGAADRERGDLGQRHGQGIETQGQGRRVEVAGGDDPLLLEEHQRVVGAAVEVGVQDRIQEVQGRLEAAVHRGDATQRDRILQPPRRAGVEQGAAVEQAAQAGGGIFLAGLRPGRGRFRGDRRGVGAEALHRQGRRDLREIEQAAGVVQDQGGAAGGGRGGVADRQAVLRPELQRLKIGLAQGIAGRQPATVGLHLALAEQRQAEVRNLAEIAGPDRADRGDHRMNPTVQQPGEGVGDLEGGAGAASEQAVQPDQQQRPGLVLRQGRAQGRAAGQDGELGELGHLLARQAVGDPWAKPRGQAVDRDVLVDVGLDDGAAQRHPLQRLRRQGHPDPIAGNAGHRCRVEIESGQH